MSSFVYWVREDANGGKTDPGDRTLPGNDYNDRASWSQILEPAGDGYWLEFPSVTGAAKAAIAARADERFAREQAGAQAQLRERLYEVINPAEVNPDVTIGWRASMLKDIPLVITADALALLPDTNTEGAMLVAERLRSKLAEQLIESGVKPFHVSMTLGVATLQPGESAEQTIARADAALYDGKRSGRNRVVVAAT